MITSKNLSIQHCFVDWHVHFYPSYDYSQAFADIFCKLATYQKIVHGEEGALGILVLTEREDCTFFRDLMSGKIQLKTPFQVLPLEGAVLVSHFESKIVVFPGRQINSRERIELLSLGSDYLVPSGLDLDQTLQEIKANLGFPVINWAPGKWWFGRGKIIKSLILKTKDILYFCDTSLRPKGYPTPMLMRMAKHKSFPILHGSDPLPSSQEQELIFSYLDYYRRDFDFEDPIGSLKILISNLPDKVLGNRSSFLKLFWRLKRYYQ